MNGKMCQKLLLATKKLRKFMRIAIPALVLCGWSMPAYVQGEQESAPAGEVDTAVSEQVDKMFAAADTPKALELTAPTVEPEVDVEDLKKAALELNRDLLILEEELLFPSNTQVMVFLSVDIGAYFALDAVKLSIDDKLVASHLYTERQQNSLSKGGVQRLYLGNLKSGSHEVTAIFHGIGPEHREYKRGATITIDKGDDPTMLELKIVDSSANMQPEFSIKEWQQ